MENFKLNTLNRRQFALRTLTASLGCALAAGLSAGLAGALGPFAKKGTVRIAPLAGQDYSPAFLRFCERAQFRSAEHALRSVRNANVEFQILLENPLA